MKKIININLSGRVIPIEDAAYETLQRYIESLRRYFAAEEGRDEIINDIESRIAELMNDKVRKGAGAVTEADMDEIINSMGRVEDFVEADATDATAGAGTTGTDPNFTYGESKSTRFKGRLYRDSSDKMLGGVCAGIANYLNIDPAIVRLLFAIITFGGWGFGIFLYILAWIILPAKDLNAYVGKRLFRNPEDRIIGGVAGGLAAYFRKDAWTIRFIFLAPIILNVVFSIIGGIFNNHYWGWGFPDIFFGSLSGTFILAYIVLWIVLPEARSPFEKMEMRGEKVDVNSIKQNVQDSMSSFSARAQAWGEEVRVSAEKMGARASEFANTRGKTFAEEVGRSAGPVANGIGHAIGVLFKAFFLFIAGTIAFALFVLLLAFTLGGIARPFNDFILNGFWQHASLWGIMIFFLAVPLVGIITWTVRRAMRVKSQNRYLGWTFSGLWTLGWISLFLFIALMSRDWQYKTSVEEAVTTAPVNMNKMLVRVDEPKIRYSGTFSWVDDDNDGGWDITDDSLRLSHVRMRVAKSPDSFYHVTLFKQAYGSSRNDARQRAERFTYTASTLDSALILGSGFSVGKGEKYRGQQVLMQIEVPVGKQIRFDESVEKLEMSEIKLERSGNWRRGRWEADWDNDTFYDWQPGVDYTMNENGRLVRSDRPATATGTVTGDSVYQYRPDTARNTEVDRQIEEQRRRIQEEANEVDRQIEEQRRRIQEEEERLRELQRQRNQGTTFIQKAKPKPNLAVQLPLPVYSLLM